MVIPFAAAPAPFRAALHEALREGFVLAGRPPCTVWHGPEGRVFSICLPDLTLAYHEPGR